MSKFTKFLVPFLLIALLFAQMLPMHTAGAESLPEINPKLHGLFTEEGRADTMHLLTIGMKGNKGYLEYRGNPELEFSNVVCMLNQNNVVTTYYLGEDNRVYLEDEQDHRFVEPAYTVEQRIWDLAAAPLTGQVNNGCVIAIPADNTNDLLLTSFCSGVNYDRICVPFTEQEELAAIAAKYIENDTAEYYLLGRGGSVWCISLELTDHADRLEITGIEKIMETGVSASSVPGFYFDGELIYRTYNTADGSRLMAINPETKAIYNYGVIEEGVTVWGLYEMGEMAPNCNDVPTPLDSLDATLNGLFKKDGQGDDRIVTIKTKGMKNYKQHLEFRGDPDLVLDNVICMENADREVETYYIGADDYIYIEDEQDHRFLNQTPVALREWHRDYAPAPLNYQSSNGWVVGIEGHTAGLTLTSLFTGDDFKTAEPEHCIDPALIAAKELTGSEGVYYILDRAGEIWEFTISFPDFEIVEEKEVQDTCNGVGDWDDFYFDGTWLFRTYRKGNSSVITAYHPETDILYDLGILEEGLVVYGLYEAGKIPTVEPHEHEWLFRHFIWDTFNGYKAYAVYTCPDCGEEYEVEATVTKVNGNTVVPRYKAVITAEQAPDGVERTETKNIFKTIDSEKWKKEITPVKPFDPIPRPISPRLP